MNEWTFVNILVPALLPCVVLLFLALFDLGPAASSSANPFVAVKDGQLAWAGLGFSLNALYELRHPNPNVVLPADIVDALFWELVSAVLFLMLLAALGPVFVTSITPPAAPTKPTGALKILGWYLNRGWRFVKHFKIFFVSAVLTAISAVLYWKTHLTTQG